MRAFEKTKNRLFFLRILLPAVFALALFVTSLYQFIIPHFEYIILGRKREMIRELTTSAWHVLGYYHGEEQAGRLSEVEAKAAAIAQVRRLRYGDEGKDYFWITDRRPFMVVHPFRDDLNGTDLSDFTDSRGKRLFVEMVKAARTGGDGFVDYTWQWKDDSTRIVPKLSYVKSFEPWGWIVGTGIYLEDVRAQIEGLERDVVRISLYITIAISLLLAFIVLQNIRSERRRKHAEDELRESKEKYQALVEASTEGLLMVLDGAELYLNRTLLDMSGYTDDEVRKLSWTAILPDVALDALRAGGAEDGNAAQMQVETQLLRKDGERVDVLLSVSEVQFLGKTGTVVIVRDIGHHKEMSNALIEMREKYLALSVSLLRDEAGNPLHRDTPAGEAGSARGEEEQARRLLSDMQTPLLFLSQPVGPLASEALFCGMRYTLASVLRLMAQERRDTVLLRDDAGNCVGLIGVDELREALLRRERAEDVPAFEVMRSPLLRIPNSGSVFEALMLMTEAAASCLVVTDERREAIGVVGLSDIHRSSLQSYLRFLRQLQHVESAAELGLALRRLYRSVTMIIESGAGVRHITHTLTAVNDTAVRRVLALAIEDAGPPPCDFVFLALGSEGRREQTLATDQDNAILYSDVDEADAGYVSSYFLKLGESVCAALNEAGFPFCRGEVMAMNPKWCQPLSVWKRYFTDWITTSNPQDLLDISIFFDFRCIHGNEDLGELLRDHVFDTASSYQSFFAYLAQNALRIKPPSWQFKAAETIDIKLAMLPIVDIARIYALRHRLRATNTSERLERLQDRGVFSASGYQELSQSHDLLMGMRFRHQARAIAENAPVGNVIATALLTDLDKTALRRALTQIETFQSKLSVDFRGTM